MFHTSTRSGRFPRFTAALLAVIAVISLVFVPAVSAEEQTASLPFGSAELRYVSTMLNFSAKVYAAPSDSIFAATGEADLHGVPLGDFLVYSDGISTIVENNTKLGSGLNLGALANPLAGLALATDSDALKTIAAVMMPINMLRNLDPTIAQEASVLFGRYLRMFAEDVANEAEISKGSKTVTIDGEDVRVNALSMKLDSAAAVYILRSVLSVAAEDSALKDLTAAIFDAAKKAGVFRAEKEAEDALSRALESTPLHTLIAKIRENAVSSGLLPAFKGLNNLTGEQFVKKYWPKFPQLTEQICSQISESGLTISVSANARKDTGDLVDVQLQVDAGSDSFSLTLVDDKNTSTMTAQQNGQELLKFTQQVKENSEEAYTAEFTAAAKEKVELTSNVTWNKVSGEYTANVTRGNAAKELSGLIALYPDSILITFEKLNNTELGDLSLTLRPGESFVFPD